MAGKMRVVAKLFLGTSVLATAGGGAYYCTTHGVTLPSFVQRSKPAATADLDAVASAWAEPSSSRLDNPEESSAIARSAKPEHAELHSKVGAASGDRYAIVAPPKTDVAEDTSSPIEASKSDTTPLEKADAERPVVAKAEGMSSGAAASRADTEPTPAPTVDDQPVKLASHNDTSSDAGSKPQHVDETEPVAATPLESPIARGQEPKDAPAVKASGTSEALESAFDGSQGGSKSLTEPRPLAAPVQQTKIEDASARAKQAFSNSAQPSASDRYSNAASPAREKSAPTGSSTVTNPFTASSAATPPAPPKSDRIEPLSPVPIHSDIPTHDSDQTHGLRQLEGAGTPTTSSINRDTPTKAFIGQSPQQLNQPSPYNRTLAAPNSLGRNDDITPIATGEGTGKPGEKALEGPQQPTLVIQKFAPTEIQVGKTAKFVLQVRNAGAQTADGVTIHDEVPQGTKLISTSPNATTEGSHIVWQIGKLSPGEDRTVEMQLMPTTEGEIGSVATVSYSAQASVRTRCTMPQLAIRMTAASEVLVGQQQHIKIEIRNPGSGDATGVILFENVPLNVKHVAGPALEFEIGTLHPNDTRDLDLVLTAEKAGKVVNTLTAKADGNLQVQQQVEFEVIAPELTVALDGPERRYLERPATYEVTVENPGTAPAHNIQIVTKLPKGMQFVRANNMGEYDAATHAVYWSLAELPKGEHGTVELVAMPTETGTQTLEVDSHAQQGLADHKQREITVEGLAAIMFELHDSQDPIEVGGETGYEIRVVNQGTKAATNVHVVVDVPPGLKVISADGEVGHKIQDGRLIFDPVQQLAPKADTVFHIRAQGLQAGDQRVTVEVNTDDIEQPIRREESTRVFGDQ